MSATSAAPAVIQRSHSSSRRGHSYSTSQHVRTPSSSSRPPPTTSAIPHRSNSQSYSQNRPTSSQHHHQQQPQQHQQALGDILPRRDYETSHLVETAPSRHSYSRDGSHPPTSMTGTEAVRSGHRNSSRSGHVRHSSDMAATQPIVTNGESTPARAYPAAQDHNDRNPPSGGSSNRRRTTITGQSGQWALGKTIGAGSMGKVKLAKKIDTGEQVAVKIVPRQTPDDGRSPRERERQDHSKEIRTAREAAIVSLLNHPYICGMRDVVRTHYHWYMLFEYVNGGQMLDYIISHGKLKEKQARKFARQIASALDYCHRNSIVHRDLKIENILIDKTGDIKIIDFGLSNLFSPRSHLKTFCGSLYFAAPELLQAKQYTGPEVDVWSFGIVLYVLVCGKVPFDDQSMPQLHAKIKKGVVDYPQWLSAECKNLISRMLVTDPRQRASLQEIMVHPWMCKGFGSQLENYLPAREPLQLPLDPEVIQGMTGFDFGPSDFITSRLTQIIESEDYQNAIRLAARDHSAQSQSGERRRGFAGFEFYKRRNSTTSRDTLTNPSAEAFQLGNDPISAYSPLISIYHLVREKQQRQRLEASPGASGLPKSPGQQPLKVPDLPAPAAAHTNTSSYEMPGEAATGGRARPRARTQGEDDITETMKNVSLGASPKPQTPTIVTPMVEQPQMKKESTAVGLLRRLSTRRHRETDKEKVAKSTTPASAPKPADTTGLTRKSFSVRRAREREPPPVSMLRASGSQPQHQDLLTPPETTDARPRRGSNLGRSTSVNSADVRRRTVHRGVSEAPASIAHHEPRPTSGSDRSSVDGHRSRADEGPSVGDNADSGARVSSVRARSLGRTRRESMHVRRGKREEAKEADVPEETDQELAASGGSGNVAQKPEGAENVRPVYLKGLFSVSTTSPKPVSAIRVEIIRVLRQLGVEFTEMRGGFRCKHIPSIDLHRGQDREPPTTDRGTSAIFGPGTRRRISFGGFMGGGDRDEFKDQPKSPNTPKTPSRRLHHDTSPTFSEGSDMSVGKTGAAGAVGDTTTNVQNDMGDNMVLSFEIVIVKVPILALHGIQFKRMAGGTWQYKNMADKILKELRL